METREVLIIGAGPAGSALAAFLAQYGVDVLLVDRADFPRDKTCGDGLSPRALAVLRRLELLEPALQVGQRISRVRLFAPDGTPVEAPVPPYGDLPPYALVLPRLQLDDLIRQRAMEAGAEFRPRVAAVDMLRSGAEITGVRARTPAGEVELCARLTVLATGASPALLERAGLLAGPVEFGRAARAYYHGLRGLGQEIEFHFDGVPLPGYGWVFPTSATAANIGAGYFVRAGKPAPYGSPRQVMDDFVASPRLRRLLDGARPAAVPKGYPLRFDFPGVRAAFPGLALVGEACGLVNPLTGEGIDYALESAEVAGEVLGGALRSGRPLGTALPAYARALRQRFLRTFVSIRWVRDVYLRPWVFNRFAAAANRHEEIKLLLIHIALGNADPVRALTPSILWRVLASGQ